MCERHTGIYGNMKWFWGFIFVLLCVSLLLLHLLLL